MNIDQVEFRDGKWYCKRCKKEVNYFKGTYKVNFNNHKKGELKEYWRHKSQKEKCSCMGKGNKGNKQTKQAILNHTKSILDRSEKQKMKTRKKAKNKWKNKTKGQLLKIQQKKDETRKINNTFTSSEPEKRSIKYLMQKYPDFIPHPTINLLESINSILKNYPGSPDGYLPSKNAFVEFQYHWSHGEHPFKWWSIKDFKIKIEWYIRKLKSSQYDKAYYTWTKRDPAKRKWCKENKVNFLEFFSEKELDNYLKL